MALAGFFLGYCDFSSSLSIEQVAELLSSRIFGGIPFVLKDVEIDDYIGTLCLANDFLGIQVDLVGQDGKFSLELGTRPSASVESIDEVCDLSAVLKQSVGNLSELQWDEKAEKSWPFDQAPNVAAITTRQVLEGEPILRVVHYEDDHSWAFTCGTTNDQSDGRVITMEEAVSIDATIKQVANILPGWRAWRRAAGEQWQRERAED